MARKRKGKERGHEDLVSDVHQALKSIGWTIPECEDDVRRAEAELSGSATPLPKSLTDAGAVFDRRPGSSNITPKPLAASPVYEVEDNLARAARQGGTIPPEIEQRMRRDREDAERRLNRDENGEDIG